MLLAPMTIYDKLRFKKKLIKDQSSVTQNSVLNRNLYLNSVKNLFFEKVNFMKKILQHKCFSVSVAKLLTTSVL